REKQTEEHSRHKTLLSESMESMQQDHADLLATLDIALGEDTEDIVDHVLEQLQQGDVPRLREEINRMFNEELSRGFKDLNELLHDTMDEIRDGIDNKNQVLELINFDNAGRYLQIRALENKDKDLLEFKKDLNLCARLEVRSGQSTYDTLKEHASKMVKRLRSDQTADIRWREHVVTPKNWFTFDMALENRPDSTVNMLPEGDQSEGFREVLRGSGENSGGEKEKLAYVVLCAAAMVQYGIFGNRSRFMRFMMLDESFSKSSSETAQKPLSLFEQVGLQVCLLTPLEKIEVLEGFVHTVTMVHKRQRTSEILNMTIEEYMSSGTQREMRIKAEIERQRTQGELDLYAANAS
ncbi:MAG: hypothetical protein HC848_06240, partial [Limnobacter sp.]|nr:hypothetical protein [Limnobacter sp.]